MCDTEVKRDVSSGLWVTLGHLWVVVHIGIMLLLRNTRDRESCVCLGLRIHEKALCLLLTLAVDLNSSK